MHIEVMSNRGHSLAAEWDADTPLEELRRIEEQFQTLRARGFRAFGSESGQRLDVFDPARQEDVVFVSPVRGG